jgi:hypothetical protein
MVYRVFSSPEVLAQLLSPTLKRTGKNICSDGVSQPPTPALEHVAVMYWPWFALDMRAALALSFGV